LGLYNIKNALEEQCFKNIDPESYDHIKTELLSLRDTKKEFQKTAVMEMKRILDDL
jgi:(p)ppGpp synthase/HD superfamily hydrolase